jgi:Alkylmercury lyase
MTDAEAARLSKHEGAAGLTPNARQLHRALLTAFAESGRAPSRSDLQSVAASARIDLWAALGELVESDVVAIGDAGELRAAYPFSPMPTAHQVAISAGPTVYAMCAIDALGISAMLGRPTIITSRDPETGEVITVQVDDDQATWHPPDAVVFAGTSSDCSDGPSVDRTCSSINFFCTANAAMRWAASNPSITGSLLSQNQALAAGITEFGFMMGRNFRFRTAPRP